MTPSYGHNVGSPKSAGKPLPKSSKQRKKAAPKKSLKKLFG